MDDFSIDAMTNPTLIEKRLLDAFEEKVTKGVGVIVDANNTFMFLVEMFSQLTADTTGAIVNKFNALYPQRALTPEDLYMHMSDYDYVNLFASPASVNMELILGKQELINNAVPVYENGVELNYRKIIIPEHTVFTIGSYTFGLYYPIEIRINNITKSFSVVYDTSGDAQSLNGKNPLTQLNVNTVEYAFQNYKDIEIISLRIPVYQFSKTIYLQDITSTTGFHHQLSYTDRFYAIRIFRQVGSGWEEIHQTLSDTVYDPMSVTAKIVVDTEDKTVGITIPQIYFTSNLVSGQLKMVLYTTIGEMDVDIANVAIEQVTCKFQDDTTNGALTEYSRPLDRAQTLQVYPVSTKILGGSSGYTFETLRSNVINNTFYSDVIARFAALEAKMKSEGFEVTKHEDSIMNRIFYCSKAITDLNGDVIASGSVPLHISSDILTTIVDGSPIPVNYRWVRYRAADNSLMILPAALLKYNPELDCSELVPNDEYPDLLPTVNDKAAAYNKYQYTYQPFHLRMSMANKYPIAYSYNLMAPSVDRIFFRGNNASYGEAINGYTGTIVHKNGGTGGYTLRMAVTLSEGLVNAIEDVNMNEETGKYIHNIWLDDIVVYLKYSAPNEAAEGCFAILKPTLEKDGDKYLYELELDTNYYINTNHYIEFDSVEQSLGSEVGVRGKLARANKVPLQSDQWTLTFLIHKDKLKEVNDDRVVSETEERAYRAGAVSAGIGTYASNDLGDDYIAISEQQLTLNFGSYMSQIHNGVEVYTGNKKYATYQTDVYVMNSTPQYLRDGYDYRTLSNVGNLVYGSNGLEVAMQARDWFIDTSDKAPVPLVAKVHHISVYRQAMPYTTNLETRFGFKKFVPAGSSDAICVKVQPSATTLTATHFTNKVIIYDQERGRCVKLDSTNELLYSGKDYPICDSVAKETVALHIEPGIIPSSYEFEPGMAVVEVPTIETDETDATNNTYKGIKHVFRPGMTLLSAEPMPLDSGETAWILVLEATRMGNDGTLMDVTNISVNGDVVADFSVNNMLAAATDGNKLIQIANLDEGDSVPVWDRVINHTQLNVEDTGLKDFTVAIGKPCILHQKGDNILDSMGRPTAISSRSYEYYIDAIQLDARAFLDSETNPVTLRESIANLITSYAKVVDKYIPELLENTHLYYRPKRSIGNATFSIGNDITKSFPLQIATEFTLTVKQFVYEDDKLRETISDKILEYVNAFIGESTLSVTSVAKLITDNLSEYVDAVAVGGFNTKEDLSTDLTVEEKYDALNTQVLKVVEPGTKLSIRRLVYVTDRKLLDTKRGLTINFVV